MPVYDRFSIVVHLEIAHERVRVRVAHRVRSHDKTQYERGGGESGNGVDINLRKIMITDDIEIINRPEHRDTDLAPECETIN